jgi:hypothetical protein
MDWTFGDFVYKCVLAPRNSFWGPEPRGGRATVGVRHVVYHDGEDQSLIAAPRALKPPMHHPVYFLRDSLQEICRGARK